jgi:hypothetical protein
MQFSRYRLSSLAVAAVAGLGWWALAGSTVQAAPPDFQRQVRPILAQYCFKCHGPDDKSREAALRLDTQEGAVARLESRMQAVVPGQPDASELIHRIHSTDPDVVMPPPATKKTMTAAEKEVLKRWIESGAEYQPHWAFVAPRPAPLPIVRHSNWPLSPLDTLVLKRLEDEQLAPSPSADRYTLVRRAYLDLIGVPPTPEQADEFVNDSLPDAYERLVDRLLASPHYGERWTRRWLDLARYADTNGYEKDRQRSIWPYRDWVIRQMNADLPFDQFTIEQLAGDMLPQATIDQRIATGFHRNTMINEEGGIDPLEFRFHAMVDRVNTTGTVWLGLTVGCAYCHTHKFDPIQQTEYYGMFAMLNNADEPEIDVPDPGVERRRAELEHQIAALERELPQRFPPAGDIRWVSSRVVSAKAQAQGTKLDSLSDGSLLAVGEAAPVDTYTIVVETDATDISTIRLETMTHESLGSQGPGRTPHGNFVLTELEVQAASLEAPQNSAPVKISSARADIEQTGFPVTHAFDGESKTGWAIHAEGQPLNQNRAATFSLDGPIGKAGGTRFTFTLRQQFGKQHTLGRFRIALGQVAGDGRPESVRRQENLERSFASWLKQREEQSVAWTLLRPASVTSNLPLLTILDDRSILASGDQSKSDTYELAFDDVPAGIAAIRIEAIADDRLPKHGPGRVYYEGPPGDFFLSNIGLASLDPKTGSLSDRPFSQASHSFANGGNTAAAALDDNKQTGWSINGGQGRSHHAVFNLKEKTPAAGRMVLKMLFERYYAAGMGRFRVWATTDPRAAASDLPLEIESALAVTADRRSPEQREALMRQFLAAAPELASHRRAIEDLKKQIPTLPTTLVFVERPANNPRPTFRHHRGEFLQPKEQVQPAVLSILPGLPPNLSRDRLTFARWLVAPENPLVGRVTMNRQWAALFGRGIVRTTEDFGYQGESPANQPLLDWLSLEFVRQGWSMKRMHRIMTTSATYRQTSRASSELLARDPHNELLARGPRFRLEAELVRDSLLQISGLWSTRLGGPSVFPPQPANVTTEGAYGQLAWRTSEGGDRYRRGLYTFTKRTAPYAMFTTFDAPSGEACVARREMSNTPLQALTLLNDTVFMEGARELGRRVVVEGPPTEFVPIVLDVAGARSLADASAETRVAAYLFRRCLTRPPTMDELRMVESFYRAQLARFESKELDPKPLAGAQATTNLGPNDVARRAAWTATARVLLNLDETITKP